MMEKEQLRKADIFSGAAVSGTGVFIIVQALQMPMKDSWGGVQNVWFVSPALFPLLVGGVLLLLGLSLVRTALKAVGKEGLSSVLKYLGSHDFGRFLRSEGTVRFYGVVCILLVFVFLLVPRVDFFLAAILFLLVLFSMYYCGDSQVLVSLLRQALIGAFLLLLLVLSGGQEMLSPLLMYPADWLVLGYICWLVLSGWKQFSARHELRRRFRISLIIAFSAPLLIGIIFKYFLLVPMPFEGLVVKVLDALWYAEMWS